MGVKVLVVYGDSHLVKDLINRVAHPGKLSLYVIIQKIVALTCKLGLKCLFQHVECSPN